MKDFPCKLPIIFLTVSIVFFWNISFAQQNPAPQSVTSDYYKATNKSTQLTCGLSSKQLVKRKATVLKSLKNQIQETRELPDGYAFKFPGSDKVLDELTEFIKTERTCCSFFVFDLSISGDKSEAWLHMTGPEGAKNFIREELGLAE